MIKASFAGTDDSESYNGTDYYDKNAFAKLSALALSADAYGDLCSFFITLANEASKNHCKNPLHVLRKNRDVITELARKF